MKIVAYTEGYNSSVNAYTGGNPYRQTSPLHAEWERGREDGLRAAGIKPIDWAAERAARVAKAKANA